MKDTIQKIIEDKADELIPCDVYPKSYRCGFKAGANFIIQQQARNNRDILEVLIEMKLSFPFHDEELTQAESLATHKCNILIERIIEQIKS